MPNHIDPTREQFEAFKLLPRDVPINMLNLVRFNEQAIYPAGHEHASKGWSGKQAYTEYSITSGAIFHSVGGNIVWRGKMEAMVTGPMDKQWDLAFIAFYPSASSFLAMITDPNYKLSVVNRQAAVLDSRLIRFAPVESSGNGFA
jgi:uncharacterized protein (DUF1330 family)